MNIMHIVHYSAREFSFASSVYKRVSTYLFYMATFVPLHKNVQINGAIAGTIYFF